MLNDSDRGDFTISFGKHYPLPPPTPILPIEGCFLIHWNSLLPKSQPISCYPHADSSENHIISSKTLFS